MVSTSLLGKPRVDCQTRGMTDGSVGTSATGVWATLGEPRTTVELAGSGFDWLCLDAQHGHFDDATLRAVFALRRSAATTVLVRVAAPDPTLIGRALDVGADGVIVPMVNDAAAAEACVAAAHYPPRGTRSWGPLPGAGLLDLERDGSSPGGARPFCAVMVETADAVAEIDAIVATRDLDMVFVGPFDLSLALGRDVDELLADFGENATLPRIVRACERVGIRAGAYAGSPERAKVLNRQGFSWIAVTTDVGVVQLGSEEARARAATGP